MYPWSRWRLELFKNGPGIATENLVLSDLIIGLDEFSILMEKLGNNDKFNILDFFKYNIINEFCSRVYNINQIIPVDEKMLPGSMSWLYKSDGDGYGIYIALAKSKTNIVPGILDWHESSLPNKTILNYLLIIMHEIGHIARKHHLAKPSEDISFGVFPPMNEIEEWEAWLFSMMFKGFLLSEYSVNSRIDTGEDHAVDLIL